MAKRRSNETGTGSGRIITEEEEEVVVVVEVEEGSKHYRINETGAELAS